MRGQSLAHNPGLPLVGQPVRRMRRTPCAWLFTRTVSWLGVALTLDADSDPRVRLDVAAPGESFNGELVVTWAQG